MYAVFERGDGSLVRVDDFEHEIDTNRRTFYFDGSVDGLVRDNYTVERATEVYDVVNDLSSCLPRISGRYAGVSVQDGALEFAASDIGAAQELYYATTEKELIVSTDFFGLAKAKGRVDYDAFEVRLFITGGFCQKGRTTFKEVYRLPPGVALKLDLNGTTLTESYLNRFNGIAVTFDVFKNALNQSIRSVIQDDPSLHEVVMYSGGVDSTILLSLIKRIRDVTSVTYRFDPLFGNNEDDAVRSKYIAERLHVPQEFVDVDLNEINLNYLDDVILSLPFAAHLGVNFKKIFEWAHGRKTRLWCGADLDTLYYYTLTSAHERLNRFLVSDAYVRMLQGVNGYERYRLVKKLCDLSIRWLFRTYSNQRVETPKTVDELVEYFHDSDRLMAVRYVGESTESQTNRAKQLENIDVNEIRRTLFDQRFTSYGNARDHAVQLLATKLFKVNNILLYSTPSVFHALRNLRFSWLDVLFAKRFIYRYARELGLQKSDFDVREKRTRKQQAARNEASRKMFESTSLGAELSEKAENLAIQIGITLTSTDLWLRQKKLGLLWINNVREELGRFGLAPRWPIFKV